MTKLEELEILLTYSKKMKLTCAHSIVSGLILEEASKLPGFLAKTIELNQKISHLHSNLELRHAEQKKLKIDQKKANIAWSKFPLDQELKSNFLNLLKQMHWNKAAINSILSQIVELKKERQSFNGWKK